MHVLPSFATPSKRAEDSRDRYSVPVSLRIDGTILKIAMAKKSVVIYSSY